MNSIESLLKSAIGNQESAVKVISEHVADPEDKEHYINQVTETIKKLARIDKEFEYAHQLLEETKSYCFENDQVNVTEVFSSKQTDKDFRIDQHPAVKRFNQMVKDNRNIENDASICEVSVREQKKTEQLVDPITKRPIVNAVKNKLCGHIYEADTIKSLCSNRKKIKCPYIGCVKANAKFGLKDLTDDVDLLTQNMELNQLQDLVDETLEDEEQSDDEDEEDD